MRLGNTARPSGMAHSPRRAKRSGDALLTGSPSNSTSPPLAAICPLATLSKVDLPAPFGPRSAYTDPSATANETPWTTSMRP